MTFKEDEKKEVGKILKDYVLQEREGSPGLLCENLGKKSAVFAGTAHWKDWDNTFPCIPAAQQEVCVLMGTDDTLSLSCYCQNSLLSHFLIKEEFSWDQ